MEQEPKKQDEEELTDEDLDKVSGGTGPGQPTLIPRLIVPKSPTTTPKLPSGSGS